MSPGGDSGRGPSGQHDRAFVPLHSPYGETSGAVVDFIYIEPLRDRSELYDWSIDAHAHAGLHQVVLLFAGGVAVTLDEAEHDVVAPAVIAIPANVVHSFEFEPGSSGFMLTIADGQFDGSPIEAWVRSRLFDRGVTLSLEGDDALAERLQHLATEIAQEQVTVDIGRIATIDWLTRTVLVLLARESDRFRQPGPGYQGSDQFREFWSAVDAHYTEHWSVARYAQLVHVSESSLNRLCRSVAGRTAFEVIRERLEIEARRRLIYSTLPIQRIAADLGFGDLSYFARFFRSRSGLSPREFRAKHRSAFLAHR